MLVSVCCSHYRFAASFLSGFKKQPRSEPHQFDNKLICYTILPHCAETSIRLGLVTVCVSVCCVCLHVWLPVCPSSLPPILLFCVTSFSQRLLSPSRTSLGGLFRLQTCTRGWQAVSVQISAHWKAEHTDWLCRAGGFARRHIHVHALRYLDWGKLADVCLCKQSGEA